MEFITIEDFKTHMFGEVVEIISDNDEDLLIDAIATAMAEACGYLTRFDTDTIFEAESKEERRKYASLITWIKDISKWHFINICNMSVDLELAEKRYKIAIAELGKIQKGLVSPKGWPLAIESDAETAFLISSRPKRGNYLN